MSGEAEAFAAVLRDEAVRRVDDRYVHHALIRNDMRTMADRIERWERLEFRPPGADDDSHEAQIRDLLEEREELLTEIRRLRMGNHPAGRALRRDEAAIDRELRKVTALAEALTERDAEHEGGEGV